MGIYHDRAGDTASTGKVVLLQANDGQYLQACMMFPGWGQKVTLRPVKVVSQELAVRFCTIENAEKLADLLNTHAGAGYWARVLA